MKNKKIAIPGLKNDGTLNWSESDILKYNSLPTKEDKEAFAANVELAAKINADSKISIPESLIIPKEKRLNMQMKSGKPPITTENIASAVSGAAMGVAANSSSEKPIMLEDQTIVDVFGAQKAGTKLIGAVAGNETGKDANAFIAGSNDAILKSIAAGNVDPISLVIAGTFGGAANIKKRKLFNKSIDTQISEETASLNESLSENAKIGARVGAYDKNYQPSITQTDINKEKNRIKELKTQKLASGGEVQGPGTAKSDSIKTKLEPGSFVVPVENTPLAKSLRKRFLGGSGKVLKAKEGATGTPVKLSNGEHVFTKEEKESLMAKGVNVKALAPNARPGMNYADGGKVKRSTKKGKNWYSGPRIDIKDKVEQLYQDRNVRAYLRFVSYAESRWGKNKDNPGSTAYGDFQFLDQTHHDINAKYGYNADSSDPIEREKAAIALIIDNGADKLVKDRNSWNAADKKLNGIWTSLPGGKDPQSGVTDKANTFRTQYLNDLANTDRDTGSVTPIVPGNKPVVAKTKPVPIPMKTSISQASGTPQKKESQSFEDLSIPKKYLKAAEYYTEKAKIAAQQELNKWSKKFGYGEMSIDDISVDGFKMPRAKINGKELPIDPTISADNKNLILAFKRFRNGQKAVSEISMNADAKTEGGTLFNPRHYVKTIYNKYIGSDETAKKVLSGNAKDFPFKMETFRSSGNTSKKTTQEELAKTTEDAKTDATTTTKKYESGAGYKWPQSASYNDVNYNDVLANKNKQPEKSLTPPANTIVEGSKSALEKIQDSGAAETIFSAIQFTQGMNLVNRSKRPVDTIPLELKVRLAAATGDEATARKEAMSGLDPQTKQSVMDNLELAKRTDFAQIDQSTGHSPISETLKRVSANNKYRSIVQLAVADEEARNNKKVIAQSAAARTDSLAGDVSNYKRLLFDDKKEEFNQSQQSGAQLINAGLSNYFQGMKTRQQIKRDNELLKRYGIII